MVLQVKGELAQYCPPHNAVERISYQVPTVTGSAGLFHNIYHSWVILPVLEKVEILRPIQQVRLPQKMHRSSAIGGRTISRKEGGNSGAMVEPRGSLYLLDVEYRMYFSVWAPSARRLNPVRHRLENLAVGSGLFLGTRECLAELVPVDDRPPAPVNTIEPFFPIGCRYTSLEVVNGVVKYPDWTKDALNEWYDHVRITRDQGLKRKNVRRELT